MEADSPVKYLQKSFTMVGSPSDTYTHAKAVCSSEGHAFADRKGKCVRCGEKIRSDGFAEAEK